MNELLAKIIEIVDKNKKNYKFFIWVIVAVILILVFVPHIYLPFENKIMLKKEVDLLATISQVDYETIKNNSDLYLKYQELVNRICSDNSSYLSGLFATETTQIENILKIISGIIPGIFLIGLVGYWFKIETDEDKSVYWLMFGGAIIFTVIGGTLNYFMMTFNKFAVNCFLIPILLALAMSIYIFGEDNSET